MRQKDFPPPAGSRRPDGLIRGNWWHATPRDRRIVCDLCPRECSLREGDRGFCSVRRNLDSEMVLTTYGRSTGFCIDPIEKKPLNHFFPGTSVLSFGTAGCNLGCGFCQNWNISRSREVEISSAEAFPEVIAETAREMGCRSVAYTYNDPVVWAEYAIDTARACRAVGVKNVAVTAGYITPRARAAFFESMDAANVDLKGFTEEFYRTITYSHIQPVLDTLRYLSRETGIWLEITNLVIPGANDSMDEIRRMCGWILQQCGADVPVHFTAFHPDFRMRDRAATPPDTLSLARDVARSEGLHFVYTGNVRDVTRQSTYCPGCDGILVERDAYQIIKYHMKQDRCDHCDRVIPGRFDSVPGRWGGRRVPVEMPRPVGNPEVVLSAGVPGVTAPGLACPRGDSLVLAPRCIEPTSEQRLLILRAAEELVASHVLGRAPSLSDPSLGGMSELPVMGVFVTLKRHGRLRGCRGSLGPSRPLLEALVDSARRTALEDHRLPPVAPIEVPYINVQVNILHGMRTIDSVGPSREEAVEVGRHGLRIVRDEWAGLLLPSVAIEHRLDAESFLRHVCRKAGLPTTAWEDERTRLWTFESVEIGPIPRDSESSFSVPRDAPLCSPPGFLALSRLATENIEAMLRGRAPTYFAPGMLDGTVSGVAISRLGSRHPGQRTLARISIRPGIPLQSTLFQLCESMARLTRDECHPTSPDDFGLAVFHAPAMQGTLSRADLRGFDPARRGLLAIDRDRTALVYDPSQGAEALLEELRATLRSFDPEYAGVYSLSITTALSKLRFATIPEPVEDIGGRPPAVAGTFYPSDVARLDDLVSDLLDASDHRHPVEPWPAAMVPHAGLRYSGRLAARVLERIAIPDTVIILGPKHTREGVEWAVAPCESWLLPGTTIPGFPELARQLVQDIPGLQLDSAAHQKEHAIEVVLPLLARLSPRSRIVGIVMGNADWPHCQEFAIGLARVIQRMPNAPLLVISSDMNHFAADSENRRLDEIALSAMETLNPEHFLQVVRDHEVSMCGILPAVIVMQTLRLLGGLKESIRVGYGTSADITGDTSRVVGYAGMLLR